MESEITITVRSTEIDVNGHVNNAKYLEYLEWGREDWFERAGLDYDTLKRMDVITVMVHISANYRREAFQNDRLRVQTRPVRAGNTSFTLEQVIFNETRQAVALDATVVLVTISATTRAKVTVPPVIRRLIPDVQPADPQLGRS